MSYTALAEMVLFLRSDSDRACVAMTMLHSLAGQVIPIALFSGLHKRVRHK